MPGIFPQYPVTVTGNLNPPKRMFVASKKALT